MIHTADRKEELFEYIHWINDPIYRNSTRCRLCIFYEKRIKTKGPEESAGFCFRRDGGGFGMVASVPAMDMSVAMGNLAFIPA